MNPAQLLEHFDRTSEAPDAIPRLRRFILDLAVRGKLVEQDPNDEPASELLKRIKAEKAQSNKASKAKNPQTLSTLDQFNVPFTLPSNWTWTWLGEIGDWGSGSTPPRGNGEYYGGDMTWLKSGELGDSLALVGSEERVTPLALEKCSFRLNKPGDVLIAMYGATIGKVAILAEEAVSNQAVCGCTPVSGVFNKYLFLFLLSRREDFRGQSEGGAQPNISKVKIVSSPFTLPPLAEQHRIVAKVDELMALCDKLEAAKKDREQSRDLLVAASLLRLNQPAEDDEAFREDARFTFNYLPRLTTRPGHIKQLRQTILNLAVRGKLVPQDPNDEPAAELLKRIQVEKARLVKEGKRKKESALPEVDQEQVPFALPIGWTWARFPELGTFGRGKSKHRPRNDSALFDGGTHLLIQTGDVARAQGVIRTYTNKYNDVGLSQSMKWPAGTLCITIAANIADSGILGFDACFPDSVVGFIPASMFRNARYFEYFVRTAKANLLEFAPATAQKNINLEILSSVLIPLPPTREQECIVAKVDELMALCDQLEVQLVTTETDNRRLLEAVLQVALQPALKEAA
jgi:type I restriction enzyme S subunit